MTPSIPASEIVNVAPQVIGAGGTGLDLNGLILTANTSVPIGTVQSFPDVESVSDFFGPLATETLLANVYFAGFDGSNIKPAELLFMQYATSAVVGYLRGGSQEAVTLAELQAISGLALTLTVDGQTFTSNAITLSGATSFSNAATIITTALNHWDAVVTGAIAGTTLTVSAVTSGALAVGQTLSGSGVTPGTVITAFSSGTGGTGTYTVSPSQTASSTTVSAGQTRCVYNSTLHAFEIYGGTPGAAGSVSFATGTAAVPLKLTAATGAVQSPGSAAMTPGSAMAIATSQTQNFASFMTVFKPSIADMVAFASWTNDQDDRFLYAAWDNDTLVTSALDNPATFGAQLRAAEYAGTAPIYDPTNGPYIAAFVLGAAASLDFAQLNGRYTFAFRAQDGLTAGVTNRSVADMLIANGYNFYGAYATANDRFVFLYPGSVSGDFLWLDSYVNQIWLNNELQLALMELLTTTRSIPYNDAGYGMIEAAMLDTINAALDFGAIRAGVTLSSLQASQVNAAAGLRVSDTIEQRGWYVQVKDPGAAVRAARGSPAVTLWYTDGQSVQTINLASVEIQ